MLAAETVDRGPLGFARARCGFCAYRNIAGFEGGHFNSHSGFYRILFPYNAGARLAMTYPQI
jgi:hypothetical protein